MIKLPTDIKTQWLEALRSGKYKQGTRFLRSPGDEFCCLGVLCDLVDSTKWKTVPTPSPSGYLIRWGEGQSMPDRSLLKTLNEPLFEALSYYPLDEGQSVFIMLAHMNDRGASFTEIATWIEENL